MVHHTDPDRWVMCYRVRLTVAERPVRAKFHGYAALATASGIPVWVGRTLNESGAKQ
jgi:hypothetical protein